MRSHPYIYIPSTHIPHLFHRHMKFFSPAVFSFFYMKFFFFLSVNESKHTFSLL
jgi:hypothetical protein